MKRIFGTKLEEAIEATQDKDLDSFLIRVYNDADSYSIIQVQEGSIRSGKYNMRGKPIFANQHFRVVTENPDCVNRADEILYEFIRTDSDLVTSIWVSNPKKEAPQEQP